MFQLKSYSRAQVWWIPCFPALPLLLSVAVVGAGRGRRRAESGLPFAAGRGQRGRRRLEAVCCCCCREKKRWAAAAVAAAFWATRKTCWRGRLSGGGGAQIQVLAFLLAAAATAAPESKKGHETRCSSDDQRQVGPKSIYFLQYSIRQNWLDLVYMFENRLSAML